MPGCRASGRTSWKKEHTVKRGALGPTLSGPEGSFVVRAGVEFERRKNAFKVVTRERQEEGIYARREGGKISC